MDTVQSRKIKFIAVGDVNLGDHPVCVGWGVNSLSEKQGYEYPLVKVAGVLSRADITFGNLESVLSRKGYKKHIAKSRQLRSVPEAACGLVKAGFKLMNVANNHALQHGREAFLESVDVLRENNIRPVGLCENDTRACIPEVIKLDGISVGFLGYAFEADKYYNDKPLYAFGEEHQIKSDIVAIKKEVDILVVSCHWGLEFINRPAPATINLARGMIDCGANIIIGHHPHVIQGIERHKSGIIAYSLGNFVCDMLWDKKLRKSLILQAEFSKAGITDVSYLPVYINSNYQPELLAGAEGDALLAEVNRLSRAIEAEQGVNYEEKNKVYLKEFNLLRLKNRSRSHRYLILNLWKYQPFLLLQSLLATLGRRLARLFINFKGAIE